MILIDLLANLANGSEKSAKDGLHIFFSYVEALLACDDSANLKA